MLSHETVWAAIDALAAQNGLSPSGLARRAGLDPTSFNPSKRYAGDGRPRWPSTESLAKILNVTGEALATFAARVDVPANRTALEQTLIPVPGRADIPETVSPDTGHLTAGPDLARFDLPALKTGDAVALRVSGDIFRPLYRNGDVIVVSREAEIRRGDRLAVKPQGAPLSLFELSDQTPAALKLRSLGDKPASIRYSLSAIEWTARIIWASQ